ncbi:unnamed protein product [Heligmosomoides polygyrus]|uniref:VHS domain-containing protein n=1 Tax=Heligmosomoides polygyrus TaxID=6339 RepID=A0A183GLI5_HELPZ|nr:unnamed protein product [Heligmosomoides polygyrus]
MLGESCIAKEKRVDAEKEMEEKIGIVESLLANVEQGTGIAPGLVNEIVSMLDQKEIGTVEEWKRYVTTMKRDGEMLVEICRMLNTNVFQLESSSVKLQEAARKGEAHDEEATFNFKCFESVTLGDVQGVPLPGAFTWKPFVDVWSAWRTCSIFIRTDIAVAEKIQLCKAEVVSLDAEALKRILILAYEVCTEWTEFICSSRGIAKHPPIDGNCIIEFYRIAFEKLK